MVERFNSRVQREVLRHHYLQPSGSENPTDGFDVAYNGRRQRTLKGLSPEKVLHQRLKDKPTLARTAAKKPIWPLWISRSRLWPDAKRSHNQTN